MDFQEVLARGSVDRVLKVLRSEIGEDSYGLLFSLDEILVGKGSLIKEKLTSKAFIEARVFNKEKELFAYYDGDGYRLVETDKTKYDGCSIEREYILDKKFKGFSKVKVREFIDFDDDGQAYVRGSSLEELLVGDENDR